MAADVVLVRGARSSPGEPYPWIATVTSSSKQSVTVAWSAGSYYSSWGPSPAFKGCQPEKISKTYIIGKIIGWDGKGHLPRKLIRCMKKAYTAYK